MSSSTTAVAINELRDQNDLPNLTLRAIERSPRQSREARADQISELAWISDWLRYMTDRCQHEQRLVLLRDRFADRYSLRNRSFPQSGETTDESYETSNTQASEIVKQSDVVEALEVVWSVLNRTISTLTRGKKKLTILSTFLTRRRPRITTKRQRNCLPLLRDPQE